jgi:hypothetical protein
MMNVSLVEGYGKTLGAKDHESRVARSNVNARCPTCPLALSAPEMSTREARSDGK